ncbi:MAG: gliding motility-associated C-terminal domain-containing protein, partial [Flavobacteriaceae bacterium]
GDRVNDLWKDDIFLRYPNNEVWIYSRSGQLIYNVRFYQNSFDGQSKSKPLPEGSYYYLIDFNQNGQVDYQGWLYLTR